MHTTHGGGWLPPWPPLGVIVVFRVRQELQSLRPQQCLPGSAAAITRQLVSANPLRLLWKTAWAAADPASCSLPTEKLDVGKTTRWSSGAFLRWTSVIKHPRLSS